jgi:uncharacterized protein YaaW (UPF0174 family)
VVLKQNEHLLLPKPPNLNQISSKTCPQQLLFIVTLNWPQISIFNTGTSKEKMLSPHIKLIRKIKRMLIEGPEYCLEEVAKFTNLVNKLNIHSFSLSSEQLNFMLCVNKLKKEMLADAPLLLFVNIAQQQNQRAISMLFDEIWFLKEDMRMYEGSLAAFFHEEDIIGHQLLDPGHDTFKLKVRISEIKDNIQEDIIKLLIKRKTLMDREAEMRELGKDLSTIIDKQKIASSFMEAIRNLWTAATDAGNLL